MFIALIVLSTAGVKNETPPSKAPQVLCLDSYRGSVKTETAEKVTTNLCKIKQATPTRKVEK